MTTPYITTYSVDPGGMGYGSYARVPTRLAKFRVEHDLSQGDSMSFQTMTKAVDTELTHRRPIRFYTETGDKLFDGIINNVAYDLMGNDWKKLTGTASGWWQELKTMELLKPLMFSDKSPNYMFDELCNIANKFGIQKYSKYVYDTDKIPYYSLFSDAYDESIGADIEFTNVFQAMQDITSYLDVAETLSPFDFGLRIESLAAAPGETYEITGNESDSNIHIIPYVLREDGQTVETYKTFKLEAGFNVQKDYKNYCNTCIVIGDGVHTQQIRTDKILESTTITSNDQYETYDNQAFASHYLAVTVDNDTGSDVYGWLQITRVEGTTNYTETRNMRIPDGKSLSIYTNDRTGDGVVFTNPFRFVDMNGCTVYIEEVTNDVSPYQTTIAGRSLNATGYAAKKIYNTWANTQARADALAGKMVRLYQNPTILVDIPVLQKHSTYTNTLGKQVDVYSQFKQDEQQFVVTASIWEFTGEAITQRLKGIQHQTCWDAEIAYYFVDDSSDDLVIDSAGKSVIVYR